jgi:AhpD family alkylhydroperoxidase
MTELVPKTTTLTAGDARMENTDMMLDWNEYRKQVTAGVRQVGQLSPDTVKGYMELSSAGNKKNLLGPKVRELISLAVAVTLRCDGCITVHTDAALRHGATEEEIAEALGVAVAINAGAALVYTTRVLDAVRNHPSPPSPAT